MNVVLAVAKQNRQLITGDTNILQSGELAIQRGIGREGTRKKKLVLLYVAAIVQYFILL